jgi:AcrR family transcriptional regulator
MNGTAGMIGSQGRVEGAARRGRPPLDPHTRETRILDALEQVISEAGLKGASMNAVARAAGMSKRTLYAHYDGRTALVEAWVRRVRASLVRELPDDADARPLAERLRLLLRREVQYAHSKRRMAALRAVIAEAPRNPDLARTVYRESAVAAKSLIEAELRRALAAGEIAGADPRTAADILFEMVYQSPLERLMNPDACTPTASEADRRLDMAIAIFLHGLGSRD